MKPYILIRDTNKETIFEAAYAKHYYEGYCALFENYPSNNTRVLLCRRLNGQDKSYKHNLMTLFQQYTEEESRLCGYMVTVTTVNSEEEATRIMMEDLAGAAAIKRILEEEA